MIKKPCKIILHVRISFLRNYSCVIMSQQNTELRKLKRVLMRFQELDMEMQIPTILILLEAAMQDPKYPKSIKTLGALANQKSGSASRNVMAYCERNRMKEGGHGFLKTEENPEFRVEKLVSMTPKGELFVQSLVDILNEH